MMNSKRTFGVDYKCEYDVPKYYDLTLESKQEPGKDIYQDPFYLSL